MSKIDKEFGMDDVLGMLDADKTVVPKKENVIPISSQEESDSLDPILKEESVTPKPSKTKEPTTKVHNQNESKTDNKNSPRNAKVVASSSKKIPTSKTSIFEYLKNFSQAFLRGNLFTSVMVCKEKSKHLKLLSPGESNTKIVDRIITDHLKKNRAKLKKNKEEFFDKSL